MKALLRQLGLNQYEIKAYLELLRVDSVTGYQLGRLSGVPQGRIYDILESLVSKGLVEILPGVPKQVRSIEPRISLKAILAEKDRQWKTERTQIDALIESLDKKEVPEEITLARGESLYYQSCIEIHSQVKKELLTIFGGLTPVSKGIDLLTPTKLNIKSGVDFRVIFPLDKKNKQMAYKMKDLGVKIRNYPVKNLRMHIADGKYAMLTIVNEPKRRILIKINQSGAVATLREMFLALWDKAKEI
jgi:sugar-specific transcriptional regulator TrmB